MDDKDLGNRINTSNALKQIDPGRTNVVQSSLDLSNWTSISTNVAVSNNLHISDPAATHFNLRCFYRTFEMR